MGGQIKQIGGRLGAGLLNATRWGLGLVLIAAGGLVLAQPVSIADAERKPGRVVRVERPTNRRVVKPQVCMFAQAAPGPSAKLTCIGKRIYRKGEKFTLLSEDRAHARLTVEASSPSSVDSCNLGYSFDVDVRVDDFISGSNPQGFSHKMAVRGLDTIAQVSKTISPSKVGPSPSGNSTDNVILAIDRVGDGAADFLVVLSACPKAQVNKPWTIPGKQLSSHCLDYWDKGSGEWRLETSDLFHFCQ